jgi:hypothetical protein
MAYDGRMVISRERPSAALTFASGLVFLSFLACKCGDPSGGGSGSGSKSDAVVGSTTTATTDEAPGDADIAVRLLKKLHDAACSSPASPHRLWCLADGYATAPAGELPGGEKAVVGLSIGLSEDFPAEQSLSNNVSLSALGISGGGSRKAWISSIKPNTPGEQKDVGEAVFNVAAVLKDKAAPASLAPTLFNYVRSLPGKAKYPLARGKKGWVIQGPAAADVRRVGAYWVAVELPAARPIKGVYLSIFTDKYGSK